MIILRRKHFKQPSHSEVFKWRVLHYATLEEKTLSSAENTRIAVKNLSADRKKSRLVSNQNFCMKSMPRDIA